MYHHTKQIINKKKLRKRKKQSGKAGYFLSSRIQHLAQCPCCEVQRLKNMISFDVGRSEDSEGEEEEEEEEE